jgi:anti-sigma factor ChrR (cupin superfamily)
MTPLVIHHLLQRAPQLRHEAGWEPFRPGVQIRRLYQAGDTGPAAALLCYEPGAAIPAHEHLGYEHILVLDGAQADEHGVYPAGTLLVNPPGSAHQVASDAGCVVLIIWERGVRFLASAPESD